MCCPCCAFCKAHVAASKSAPVIFLWAKTKGLRKGGWGFYFVVGTRPKKEYPIDPFLFNATPKPSQGNVKQDAFDVWFNRPSLEETF